MTNETVPQEDETWTNTISMSEHIVAEVTENLVIFVGMNGRRLVYPRTSFPGANSFMRKMKGPPLISQACSRFDCSRNAFLVYQRPGQSTTDFVVCPKHMPRGVYIQLLPHPRPFAQLFEGDVCPRCGKDGIEVFFDGGPNNENANIWSCIICHNWWMRVYDLGEIIDPARAANLLPVGFNVRTDSNSSEGWVLELIAGRTSEIDAPPQNIYDYVADQQSTKTP